MCFVSSRIVSAATLACLCAMTQTNVSLAQTPSRPNAADAAPSAAGGTTPSVLPAKSANNGAREPLAPPAGRPLFSARQLQLYTNRIWGGSLLVVGGGAALVFSVFFAFEASFAGLGTDCDEADDPSSCKDRIDGEHRDNRAKAWALLGAGIAAIGIGIPLLVNGAKGRKRQLRLELRADPGAVGIAASFSFL